MILVLEDNKALKMIMRKALEKEGYEVKAVANGKEGLEVLNEETPELIISDVVMPEMDGFEFLKKVRKKHPLIPFTFLTVKSEIKDYSKGYKLGATDYLTKPFKVKTLLKKVNKRLKSAKLLKEILEEGKKEIDIEEIMLIDLVNSLKKQKLDCILSISSSQGNGEIKIDKGKIKKSSFNDLKDKKALSKIVGLNKGKVKIER